MTVRDAIGELFNEPNWERQRYLRLCCVSVDFELIYATMTAALTGLWFYNLGLWIAVPMFLIECDDTCKIVIFALLNTYLLLACVLALALGLLALNTIWKCVSVPSTLLFVVVSPFIAPLTLAGMGFVIMFVFVYRFWEFVSDHVTIEPSSNSLW